MVSVKQRERGGKGDILIMFKGWQKFGGIYFLLAWKIWGACWKWRFHVSFSGESNSWEEA
jgi:hypothetical protein